MRQAWATDASQTASELLERGGEFGVLEELFETVRGSSRGRLVLVSGEPGIGKTALLRRFCTERDLGTGVSRSSHSERAPTAGSDNDATAKSVPASA